MPCFYINSTKAKRLESVSSSRLCLGKHPIRFCRQFRAMNLEEKLRIVLLHDYCSNYLSHDHLLSGCVSNYRCRRCQERHHTLLHDEAEAQTPSIDKPASEASDPFWPKPRAYRPWRLGDTTESSSSECESEARPRSYRLSEPENAVREATAAIVARPKASSTVAKDGDGFRPRTSNPTEDVRIAEARSLSSSSAYPYRRQEPKSSEFRGHSNSVSRRPQFRHQHRAHPAMPIDARARIRSCAAAPIMQSLASLTLTALVRIYGGRHPVRVRVAIDSCLDASAMSTELARDLGLWTRGRPRNMAGSPLVVRQAITSE